MKELPREQTKTIKEDKYELLMMVLLSYLTLFKLSYVLCIVICNKTSLKILMNMKNKLISYLKGNNLYESY